MAVQTLDRAFDIVELLSRETGGLNLTEIASRMSLNKSTAHRILASLQERGYVEKREQGKVYRLGLELIELSSAFLNSLELKTEAQPILNQLSRQSGQTVFMAIMREGDVVYIDKVEAFNSLRRYKIIGKRMPLYATSLGKSLLTGLTDAEIVKLYRNKPFKQITDHTIDNVHDLLKEVELTRRRGWAHDNQENELGTMCVGAPVYDYRNMVIAAVSVAWEIEGQPDLDLKRLAALVVEATQEISHRMGYRWKTASAKTL
ncbi:MAG: IclR family transcriptional regulator [Desulfovibrionaceae bacterium]|nr:IclR family transcriptional regulator [Desulfovibrionaceae bacterium]